MNPKVDVLQICQNQPTPPCPPADLSASHIPSSVARYAADDATDAVADLEFAFHTWVFDGQPGFTRSMCISYLSRIVWVENVEMGQSVPVWVKMIFFCPWVRAENHCVIFSTEGPASAPVRADLSKNGSTSVSESSTVNEFLGVLPARTRKAGRHKKNLRKGNETRTYWHAHYLWHRTQHSSSPARCSHTASRRWRPSCRTLRCDS